MADANRLLRVFLCHASADAPAVHALYKRLVNDGVDAWIDTEKLLPGQNWQAEISLAVRNSDIVIVCLSKKSVNKEGYVQKEIKLTLDVADEKPEGTIFIIPARIESCDVPTRLNIYQWVDMFSTDGYDKLQKALSARAESIGKKIIPEKVSPKKRPSSKLSQHLVTNSEYLNFVKNTNYRKPRNWNTTSPHFPVNQAGNPVVAISWDDAIAYCDWSGGCLPGIDNEVTKINTVEPRISKVNEWRDLGSELQKQVYDFHSSRPVELVDREKLSENIGFRCVSVRPMPSTEKRALIQGGTYLVGADLERFRNLAVSYQLDFSQRQLILGRQARPRRIFDFSISVTCTTNEEYFKFTKATGANWPNHWHRKWLPLTERPFPVRLQFKPVTNVTADDAKSYCRWTRTRLPNWYEWERAASGKDKRPYPWGENYDSTHNNSKESGRGALVDVDEYPLGDSEEGVRQLCGNINEWVIDPDGRFELRGGSYRMGCELWGLAYVFRQVPYDFSAADVGFRVIYD